MPTEQDRWGRDVAIPVLVVEGDLEVRAQLAETLGAHGYEVQAVGGGAEALAAIAAGAAPEVILLDAQLADMDSWEFVRRLRSRRDATARLVGVTAAPVSDFERNRLGALALLGRPVDPRHLLAVVARMAPWQATFAEREDAAAGGTCLDSGAPAAIFVHGHPQWVRLAVRVRGERLVKVALGPEDCADLIAALQQAYLLAAPAASRPPALGTEDAPADA